MDLDKIIRNVADFPKPGIQFKDITPVLANKEAFAFCVDQLYQSIVGLKVDIVLGIESRGFIFAAAIAAKYGIPMNLIRKPGKLPADKIRQEYQLEYGSDALEIHRDAIKSGERVFLVDDLLATGGTAAAACQLVRTLGGMVVQLGFVIELSFLNGKEKLKDFPVFSILQY